MRKFTMVMCITGLLLLAGCNLSGSPEQDNEQALATPTVETLDIEETAEVQNVQPTRTPFPDAPTALPTLNNSSGTTGNNTSTTSNTTSQQIQQFSAPVLDVPAQGEHAFSLRVDGGVNGDGLNLLPLATMYYAQNPVSQNTFAVIDTSGNLYITSPNGANAFRIEQGPYTQYPAASLETNNAAARVVAWSPSGQYLAFIVRNEQQASDGVWYFEPGQFGPLQLIVDCPFEGFIGCNIVQPSPDDPINIRQWTSKEIYWSPDSNTLLVNVNLPQHNRRGIIIMPITRFERVRDMRPPVHLYDFGTWGADGRILASGAGPDNTVNVMWLGADGTAQDVVYPASQNGLWMGWAVERPNGDIIALGAPTANQAVAIYDMNGNALTEPIGIGFPERVEWSPDRSGVIVEMQGRQYIATIDGQITDITVPTGNTAINWVQ